METTAATAPGAAEAEWIARARRGDAQAFERLYREHVGRVHGLCLRMTGHRETAEDCTQEAFISAWRSLPGFESRSGFGTWLHRIAVNAVLARARGPGARRHASLTDDDGGEIEFAAEERDAALPIDLEKVIGTLPEGARHVLVLYGVYGYQHDEIAAMLGIAVGTCKAQLHRARRLLGERLRIEEPQ